MGHTAVRRNLSTEHNPSTSIKEAVELLANNLSDWMAPRESVININSLQKLMSTASGFERSHKKDTSSLSFLPKRDFSKKAGPKAVYTSEIPDKKAIKADISEGRDRAEGSRNRQTPSTSKVYKISCPQRSLDDMKRNLYSFRRDKVVKIFKQCLKQGLELPESKRPNEAMKVDDPNYCLYHRVASHKIEDYWVIKD